MGSFLGGYGVFWGSFLPVGVGEQWSVVSGQWSVEAAIVFGGQISKNARFLKSDVPDRIGCWRGWEQWLVVGGQWPVVAGGFFCSTEMQISTKVFGLVCSGSDRLLVGILVIGLRAKAQRRQEAVDRGW
jgi:hypothetical protein